MQKEQTAIWLESQKKHLNIRRTELDCIEILLDRIGKPSKDKYEAIERLNMLLKWWEIRPQHGPFPVQDIMEELLMDQDYRIKNNPCGTVSFVVNDFEIELKPDEYMLKITYMYLSQGIKREVWKDRFTEEYAIMMDSQKNGSVKTARSLAMLSFQYDAENPTFAGTVFRTLKYLKAIRFGDLGGKMFSRYKEERLKWDIEKQKETDVFYQSIAEELIALKSTGLYETIELIEKNTDCLVNFDIFVGSYSCYNGIDSANAFIEKYGHKKDA